MIEDKKFYQKIFKMVAITGFFVVLAGGLIFYLDKMLKKEINNISQNQLLLKELKTTRLLAVSLKNDYQKIKEILPIIEVIFPDENLLYYSVNHLKTLAEKSGNQAAIEVLSDKVLTEPGFKNNYVNILINLSGNYQTLKNYLDILNNRSLHFLKVEKIEIQGPTSIKENSAIKISAKLYVK